MITPENSNTLTAPFWAAAERGQLQVSCCERCAKDIWYPQESCPICSGELVWRSLEGRARLLSWTVVRRQINGAFDVPYTPAIVIPDDAPDVQLVTQLFLPKGQSPECDMPLQVAFRRLEPLQGAAFIAPVFEPREAS